jgi:hypothetical protein
MTTRSVLFACDLDSQIFGALPLALAFRARGWRTVFAVDSGPACSLPHSVRERLGGRFEVLERSIGALAVDEAAHGFDAVGVYATGSRLARFRHDFSLAARTFEGPRPALFCGYNGVVFEKFEEGLAWRLGYDLICLNGPRDRDAFVDFVGPTAFAAQPTVTVGLRRRTDVSIRPLKPAPSPGRRRTLVFAEQVAVPAEAEDRAALVASLARLAAASPNWDVIIKGRVRPTEQTFFEQVAHVETLVATTPARPPNLTVTYEPLDALLERADLFGTVSSTALFDAIDHGVPSFVVADFGVRNAYGTHVFFGSGLLLKLASLASLDASPRLSPDMRWLDRIGYGPPHSVSALIDALERFDPGQELPPAFHTFEPAPDAISIAEPAGPDAIRAGRAKVEAALAADDRSGARAALASLGATIAASDRQRGLAAAWRRREGRLADFSRSLGMYWLFKRIRRALLGEIPR